jgi:hypothetical protein
VLYTRRDCPLCFVLHRAAARAARRHGVRLIVEDVDAREDLKTRYGDAVPVLVLPGGLRIAGRAPAAALDAAFRAAAGARPGLLGRLRGRLWPARGPAETS